MSELSRHGASTSSGSFRMIQEEGLTRPHSMCHLGSENPKDWSLTQKVIQPKVFFFAYYRPMNYFGVRLLVSPRSAELAEKIRPEIRDTKRST